LKRSSPLGAAIPESAGEQRADDVTQSDAPFALLGDIPGRWHGWRSESREQILQHCGCAGRALLATHVEVSG
jgi:hypothetical protein